MFSKSYNLSNPPQLLIGPAPIESSIMNEEEPFTIDSVEVPVEEIESVESQLVQVDSIIDLFSPTASSSILQSPVVCPLSPIVSTEVAEVAEVEMAIVSTAAEEINILASASTTFASASTSSDLNSLPRPANSTSSVITSGIKPPQRRSLIPLSLSSSHNVPVPVRKSLSPRHLNTSRRTSSTSSTSSTASGRNSLPLTRPPSSLQNLTSTNASTITRRVSTTGIASSSSSSITASALPNTGTLLQESLMTQLHGMKVRNSMLEKLLSSEKEGRVVELGRARGRIESLEKVLEGSQGGMREGGERMKLEKENENKVKEVKDSLALSLVQVEGLKYQLEEEKAKKGMNRILMERLRLELKGRKSSEKWELGMIDVDDRQRDVEEVVTEFELGVLKMNFLLEKVEREECEAIILERETKISSLHSNLTSLRTNLSLSQSEIKSTKEQLEKVKKEVGGGGGKELGEVKKSLEKEKKVREKVEGEVKGLKAALKLSQTELHTATQSLLSAVQTFTAASTSSSKSGSSTSTIKPTTKSTNRGTKRTSTIAELPSVSVLAARKRRSLSLVPVPVEIGSEEEEEEEEEEEGNSSVELLKKEAKARALKRLVGTTNSVVGAGTKKGKGKAVEEEEEESFQVEETIQDDEDDEEEEEEEESYKPSPPPVIKSVKAKAKKSKPVVVVVAEDLPITLVSKKRKSISTAGGGGGGKTLVEKSSNNSPMVKEKKGSGLVVVKAKKVVEEVPNKKKKRTLFAGNGKAKFDWGGIENANINGFIPSNLSPIKTGNGPSGGAAGGISSILKGLGTSRW